MKVLNICGMLDNSLVNGEGMRFVIFLAGCPHHCSGCQNSELQENGCGENMTTDFLLEKIKSNIPIIDGITLSGGEPFEQDSTELLKAVKQEGLTVWVYTGYTYDELLKLSEARPYIADMLGYIDVVVDGKFDENLTEGAPRYAGSTNQRFILLEDGKYLKTLENFDYKENE